MNQGRRHLVNDKIISLLSFQNSGMPIYYYLIRTYQIIRRNLELLLVFIIISGDNITCDLKTFVWILHSTTIVIEKILQSIQNL